MRKFLFYLFCGLWAGGVSWGTELDVHLLTGADRLDFKVVGDKVRVASFLVLNPATTTFTAYLTFTRKCRVQHFTRTDLGFNLKKVYLAIDGVEQPFIWEYTGTGCTAPLTWVPPGVAPFGTVYRIDVLVDWDAQPVALAGSYTETVSLIAVK